MNTTPDRFIVPAFLVVERAEERTTADQATDAAAEAACDVNRWLGGERIERLTNLDGSALDLGIRVYLDEALPTVHGERDVGSLLEVTELAGKLAAPTAHPLTDTLAGLFEAWLDRHPHLPRRSADELLYEHPDLPSLTAAERAWLATFERLWELCQADEDKRELSGAYLMQAFHAEPIAPNRDNDDVPGLGLTRASESLQDVLTCAIGALDHADRSLERAHALACYHAPLASPTTLRAIDQVRQTRNTARDLHALVKGVNDARNAPKPGPWKLDNRPGGAHWLSYAGYHVGVLKQAHPRMRGLLVDALNHTITDLLPHEVGTFDVEAPRPPPG